MGITLSNQDLKILAKRPLDIFIGAVAFSVGMTTASTILSPILTPLLVLKLAGKEISVDAFGMFQTIMIVTIIPIALGFIVNTVFSKKDKFNDVKEVMPAVSVIGLALVVGGVIALQGSNFLKSGVTIFIAVLLHNAICYALGYLVGKLTKMNKAKKRTISVLTSKARQGKREDGKGMRLG